MKIKAKSAEQAFHLVLELLEQDGIETSPRGMKIKEILNCNIEITNPRDRIVNCPERKFSAAFAFGELMWYLAARNDLAMMEYYSKFMRRGTDDGETLNSAYGYRIFGKHPQIGFDQWKYVREKLIEDPDSRQAVIHLHTPNNQKTNDEVCTLSLQFLIRNNKLDMIVTMRSNDIVLGFTYDVFAFTMMQEMLANELGVKLGTYHHNAGSMHIYENKFNLLDQHTYSDLPPMEPFGYSKDHILELKQLESMLRITADLSLDNAVQLNPLTILRIYKGRLTTAGDNLEKFMIASYLLKFANVLFDLDPVKYASEQNEILNTVRKSNETYADILQYTCNKLSKDKTKIIVEGIDGAGKSTLVSKLVNEDQFVRFQVQHYSKPTETYGYYENYMHNINNPNSIIFDRFVFSEEIYSSVFSRPSNLCWTKDELGRIVSALEKSDTLIIFIIAKDEKQKQVVLNRMTKEDREEIAPYFDELNRRYKEMAKHLQERGINVQVLDVVGC